MEIVHNLESRYERGWKETENDAGRLCKVPARSRLSAPQAPITPGSMGSGVPAIRRAAWQLHVRADTRPVPRRNRQTRLPNSWDGTVISDPPRVLALAVPTSISSQF